MVAIGQAMDSVSNFMLLAASQSAFLLFFRSATHLMLPLGVIMRSFSLTRKVGGVLLAAVIASSVIYPAGIMVSKEIYASYSADLRQTAEGIAQVEPAGNPPLSGAVCSPYMQTFVMSPLPFVGGELGWYVVVCIPLCALFGCHGICYKIIELTFMIVKSLFPILIYASVLLPYAGTLGNFSENLKNYYVPLEQYALPAAVKYAVLSTVLFIIPLIIAMALLRNLAVTFGGEPQLYGLAKLV